MEKMLADSETQLEACMRSLSENAAILERDAAELGAGKAELDRVRDRFNETDGRRTAAQRELQAQAEQIDALRARVDEHTDKRHRCELQLQRVETEFKQIEERIWEDYELTYALAEPFRQEGFRLSESEKRIAAIRARIREMGRGERLRVGRIPPDGAASGGNDHPARRPPARGAGSSKHRRRTRAQNGEPVQARICGAEPELPKNVCQAVWAAAARN